MSGVLRAVAAAIYPANELELQIQGQHHDRDPHQRHALTNRAAEIVRNGQNAARIRRPTRDRVVGRRFHTRNIGTRVHT